MMAEMRLHFLGATRTVTGSQYLLETDRARVLIDCGMFQGSPNDVIRNRVPFAYPPNEVDDTKAALGLFRGIDYGAEMQVAPGITATYLDAGHILGSAIIRVRVTEGDQERTIIFSGDLGRPGSPIIRDPTPVTTADYLLIESTYGGKTHEPQDEAIRMLGEAVKLTGDAKGVLLMPSFAIGRTQEIVYELNRLLSAGTIPHLPLYLDSPMAGKASDAYRAHLDYFDDDARALVARNDDLLDYPDAIMTNNAKESLAIEQAARPFMVVASNGMITGGRIVQHVKSLVGDPAMTLLFVGYQGDGTLGAHLQQGAKQVRIDGQDLEVHCQVRSISGFSAHADEPELLAWLGNFAQKPRTTFIVHGDPAAQAAFEPKVRALGFATSVPAWRETVELT